MIETNGNVCSGFGFAHKCGEIYPSNRFQALSSW